METALEILGPVIATLIAILIPAAVTALFRWFQKLGIDIEASHREALQSALTNAAMLALSRGRTFDAVNYVRKSVPDAVKAFRLDDGKIIELLDPKIAAAHLPDQKAQTVEKLGQHLAR